MTTVTQQYITPHTPMGVNPMVVGNGGSITADGMPMHDLPSSAQINIPANSLLVFAFDS